MEFHCVTKRESFNVLNTFRSNVFHGVLEYSTVRVSAIAIAISHNDEITSKFTDPFLSSSRDPL